RWQDRGAYFVSTLQKEAEAAAPDVSQIVKTPPPPVEPPTPLSKPIRPSDSSAPRPSAPPPVALPPVAAPPTSTPSTSTPSSAQRPVAAAPSEPLPSAVLAPPVAIQRPAPSAVDSEAPKIALNYPQEGAKLNQEQIVVLGLVTDNVAVEQVLVS